MAKGSLSGDVAGLATQPAQPLIRLMPIVTTTYRYKPPPKRKGRKLAEITGPAVVTSVDPKKSSRRAGLA